MAAAPDRLPTHKLGAYWQRARFEARTPKSLVTRELTKVRHKGYAIVDEEVELGLRTIAVPIRNTHGIVIAAVNVAVQGSRIAVKDMPQRLLPLLAPAQEAMKQVP
jgi:IclR family pca regulon transcriptional regulator